MPLTRWRALVDQGKPFRAFHDGASTDARDDFENRNPANGMCWRRCDARPVRPRSTPAVACCHARRSPKWVKLGGHGHVRGSWYALARVVAKNTGGFLPLLETLITAKPIAQARDVDVPLAQRHSLLSRSMAQLMESELPAQRRLGVVWQDHPVEFPAVVLAGKVATALAMGGTTVDIETCEIRR